MLELCDQENVVELELEETSATLDMLLPYAYPVSVAVLDLNHDNIVKFFAAVGKYSVRFQSLFF